MAENKLELVVATTTERVTLQRVILRVDGQVAERVIQVPVTEQIYNELAHLANNAKADGRIPEEVSEADAIAIIALTLLHTETTT